MKGLSDDNIYGYAHRLDLVLNGPHGIRQSKEISETNKETLFKYHTFLKTRELSLPRQEKLMKALKRLSELLGSKSFQDVTREDMEQLIGNLKPTRRSGKKKLQPSTVRDFQIIVRQFYAWLFRSPKRQYPDVVAWMEPKEPKPKLQASDLLTSQEKERLKAATPNLRDKALISVFDEAGPRPGELLPPRLRNVRILRTHGEIDVVGKTGRNVVYVIEALPDLVMWLDAHPEKGNPDAYLWSDDGKPPKYDKIRNRLLTIADKAGIDGKRVYWYLLRHGSVTKSSKKLPDQLLKKRYGWSKRSRAIEFYEHLVNTDLRDTLLQQTGLQGEKNEKPTVILCPRCRAPNRPDQTLCSSCKSVLSVEKAVKIEQLEEKVTRLEERILLDRVTARPGVKISPEEAKAFVSSQKKLMKKLRDAGLVDKDET